MGKLNIAHHKSYHPYRLDNIARVRQDEEEARLKEEQEEGRMMLADSEARIRLLRERSGSSKSRRREEEERERELLEQATSQRPSGSGSSTSQGHINFFEGLEQGSELVAMTQRKLAKGKGKAEETEKGIPLAPSAKDLKPWYSDSKGDPAKEMDEDKRNRDSSLKSRHDPLTSINQQLRARSNHTHNTTPHPQSRPHPVPSTSSSGSTSSGANSNPQLDARLSRESSERQRALELKRRKQLELEGSMTPSSVQTGAGYKYGDQFNRKEVEEAHRFRERDRGRNRRDPRDRSW